MDFDLSTLLPIILGVLYYVFTGAAKNKKKAQRSLSQDEPSGPETIGPPPVSRKPTFEELLEEFTGQKKTEEVPELVPAPVVSAPVVSAPVPNQTRQRITEKKEYKTLVAFKEYEEDSTTDQEDYRELFANLDDAKRAFVASEIYNRKY